MKYTFYLFLAAALLCFTACEEQTFDPVLNLGAASAISAPADGSSFLITEETAGDELAAFVWSAADFGVATEINYTLQLDVAGNDFAEPTALVPATTMTNASVVNSTMNNELINRGLPGNVEQALEVRVKAVVGLEEDGNILYSNPITLNVTPFEAEIDYPKIYVPGAHQGWDPPSAPTIFSVESNGSYDGYVYFADASNEFKFTTGPNWDENYGDTGADGTLDNNGDNINSGGEGGLYRATFDINDLVYSITRTEWGMLGTSTPGGFDTDIDMVYDPVTGVYSLTTDLVAGEIKFRANDAWDINLGDTGGDRKMEYGGDNIAIDEDGNYTIELLLNRAVYSYTVTKN